MFGPEFLQQLAQLKNATDSGMSKLPEIVVEGNAGNGLVRIKLDGQYQLKDLSIAIDLQLIEKDDLEDFLAVALKQAIDQVTAIREKELYNSLTDMLGKK
ncbi:MAG: YbaB/EbfC family nucleoid-associated protein [Fluviicola sp.]|jgi:DNA-binding YbaB/EbfC family protein|nr:YbaB/EbfC family nucleoid-associated protein [Fluviicola sp.]